MWSSTSVSLFSIAIALSFHTVHHRLEDVVYDDGKLFLVFEFMDRDLRKYMDGVEGPLEPELVRARHSLESMDPYCFYTCCCYCCCYWSTVVQQTTYHGLALLPQPGSDAQVAALGLCPLAVDTY